MKNLGLKLRKTSPIPGKCDHQLQFDFYTRELLPRLEEATLGKRKMLFVDAAHFVLGADAMHSRNPRRAEYDVLEIMKKAGI